MFINFICILIYAQEVLGTYFGVGFFGICFSVFNGDISAYICFKSMNTNGCCVL